MNTRSQFHGRADASAGFTLAEVVLSLLLVSVCLGAMLSLYVQCANRTEWAAYSLSAHMMAQSGVEQCRAAKFDPRGSPAVDNLVSSNFPARIDVLDVSSMNNVLAYGTNTTTIVTISTNPPIKLIQVDCTWSFPRKGVFTNTVLTYRAANQ